MPATDDATTKAAVAVSGSGPKPPGRDQGPDQGPDGGPEIAAERWNALYLIAAVAMTFMTLALAAQPLFLRQVLDVPLAGAGMVNANVPVIAELATLLVIAGLSVLSDRWGRVPILVGGFLVGAVGAGLAPLSAGLGAWLGVGGVAVYYLARIIMSLGTCAVWPQLATLAGDFTDIENRANRMSNTTAMMAFGSTLVFAVLMQIPRHSGIMPLMVLDALLGLAGAWLAFRLLADTAPRRAEPGIPWARVQALLARDPRLRVAFAAALFSRGNIALIGLFYMLWVLEIAEEIGTTREHAAAHAGVIIGLAGLVLMATSLTSGRMVEHCGRFNAIGAGLGIAGIGFLAMGLVVNPLGWLVCVPLALIAIGQPGVLLAPDIVTFDITPPDLRGAMMGALNVAGGVGLIVMLEAGGVLFDLFGPSTPFLLIGAGNLLVMAYARTHAPGSGRGPKSLSRKSIHDSNRLRLGPGGHPSDQVPCP